MGGGVGKKEELGIMKYEKHTASGERSHGVFIGIRRRNFRIFPHFTDFKGWRIGYGILGRFGRGMLGRGMGKRQCLAIIPLPNIPLPPSALLSSIFLLVGAPLHC